MSRIDTLLATMTLREKLGQLNMVASGYAVTGPLLGGDSPDAIRSGDIGNLLNMVGADHVNEVQRIAVEESRLGIPLLIGLDIIHGHRTMFPVPLAEAAMFDPAAWALTARIAAVEAWNDGVALTFAPMLDVSRDLRWGRMVESAGEDPFVTQQMASAKIKGFEGADLSSIGALAATAKHFCAYGPVLAGREYASVDISERALHEVYLPPFETAVKTGVAAIMPAFTNLAGIPMTAHKPLLRGWLREKLGFEGVVISDYNAIAELLHHGVAADLAEAAALALQVGIDIDMVSNAYRKHLPEALARGLVGMEEVDQAVRRVLALKERLGLFDAPYRRGSSPPATVAGGLDHREVARDMGRRSAVLLTNRKGALPLAPQERIALIGPLAHARTEMRGPWGGAARAEDSVTLLEGLRAAVKTDVAYAVGVDIESEDRSGIAAAVETARGADVVVLCLGEAAVMSGEAASRADPGLPGQQQALADALLALGKKVVVVLFAGRPLIVPSLLDKADAVLMGWFLGEQAGPAVADLLTGAFAPTGRLPVSWPQAVGQLPLFFAHYPTGRPYNAQDHYTSKYIDVPNTPRFPFGHGLTYGEVEFADLRTSHAELAADDTLRVTATATNRGATRVEETVFLFVRDVVASVSRPVLELKGFTKIVLDPANSGTVAFDLPARDLGFLDAALKPVLEAGAFEILLGTTADRSRLLTAMVTLKT
ncbi:glycoside hydrolase family 3 N-terminal domain-containing protein [Labrys monachus]|uniref:beta-glucosidase n=1 Tax=Labrys monachus TaxID=217067 RepID=A0ABU0F978_9HYPH|nr:glycoside hydrolase family 3 N-terminal domain-containing protein [Labrys monachus]MDQ0391168.1 beta-glucosidase [Labrys monachus]